MPPERSGEWTGSSRNRAARSHAIKYRPDVDGLRAIAVLAVIGFHAAMPGFGGGFVGVDVFFVISGYLISGIIIRAIDSGTFSFRDFYARRINRIFPALLVVLACCFVFGWFVLFSSEFASLGKHIAAGSTFLSNLALIKETGYFDLAAEKKPLLHLWSLAIEEQFYLAWPLFLWLSWKMGGRRSWPAAVVGFFSLAIALIFSQNQHAQTSFYLPFTRLWELIAGFFLFYSAFRADADESADKSKVGMSKDGTASELRGWAGLGMVLASILLIPSKTAWPSALTIFPVAGTLLVLSAGPAAWVNGKILSKRIVVAVGLISYPLYLWHWPVLYFLRLFESLASKWIWVLAAIVLSIVLATLTYRLVEFPIRSRVAHRGRRAVLLGGLMAVLGVLGLAAWTRKIPVRLDSPRIRATLEAADDWTYPGGGFTGPGGKLRENTIPGTGDTVLFAGDSHMEQYWPRIDYLSKNSDGTSPNILFLTVGGCPALPNVGRSDAPYCEKFYRDIMDHALRPGIKTVVLNSFWEQLFRRHLLYRINDKSKAPMELTDASADSTFEEFSRDIAKLVSSGKKVFVVLTVPTGTNDEMGPNSLLPSRISPQNNATFQSRVERSKVVDPMLPVLSRVRSAAERGGATVLDPVVSLCSPVDCVKADSAGNPLYKDGGHLRATVARERASWIDVTLR